MASSFGFDLGKLLQVLFGFDLLATIPAALVLGHERRAIEDTDALECGPRRIGKSKRDF